MVSARIIHEGFYCNRRYAAPTSLHAALWRTGGRTRRSVGRHTGASMPSSLAAVLARLASHLSGFVTNPHELCALGARPGGRRLCSGRSGATVIGRPLL